MSRKNEIDPRIKVNSRVRFFIKAYRKKDKELFGVVESIDDDTKVAVVIIVRNHHDDGRYSRKLQDLKFVTDKKQKKSRLNYYYSG
jgi:hypothetical protein